MCTLLSVGESAYDTFFGDPAFAQKILSNAIDYKTHDHRVKGEIIMYRLYFSMKTWWMRNFPVSVSGGDDEEDDIGEKELRNILLWSQDDDSEWIDRAGVPFLMYPVIQKNVRALQESLEHLQNAVSKVKRERILRSKVKYSGSSEFKVLTGNNILHIAIFYILLCVYRAQRLYFYFWKMVSILTRKIHRAWIRSCLRVLLTTFQTQNFGTSFYFYVTHTRSPFFTTQQNNYY
jgi:hypothetical protein